MQQILKAAALTLALLAAPCASQAAPVYLNSSNMTVALGPGMAAEPFANRTTAASLSSVIDAATAGSSELHLQSTHVWLSGGTLVLDFDLQLEYDLTTFHFWNYHSEAYDVDDIDLIFFNAANQLVGTILNVAPALGNGTGSDTTPIFAQNTALAFPGRVRYVRATLAGTNGEVDFNNIGFTGEISAPVGGNVPEPSTLVMMSAGLALAAARRRRRAL